MRLVEREHELAVLTSLLGHGQRGEGRLAVVRGPVACGKTTLLHAFARLAAVADVIVLQATASRAERDLRLGVVAQLLSPHAAGPLRVHTESDDPYQVIKGIIDLSRRQTLAIMIDDVHYADGASLEVVLGLVRRLSQAPILVVLGECASMPREYLRYRAEFLRQPSLRVDAALLSPHGIAQMLADGTGPFARPGLPESFHQLSGGNPLIAGALIADYQAGGHRPDQAEPGELFRQAVAACLYRCDPDAMEVARALAILGGQPTAGCVAQIVNFSLDRVHRATDVLTGCGLMTARQLRHPAAGTAIAAAMEPPERSFLHTRAAHVLHEQGAAVTDVAAHLIAAGRVAGAWALPVLREAADQASADGDPDLAIDCLLSALHWCADQRQRVSVLAALMRARWRVSPAAASQHLPELAEGAVRGGVDRQSCMGLTGYLLWDGRTSDAIRVFEAMERGQDVAISSEPDAGTERSVERTLVGFSFPGLRAKLCPSAADSGSNAARPTANMFSHIAALLATPSEASQSSHLDDKAVLSISAALMWLIYDEKLAPAASWCGSLADAAGRQRAPMWHALFTAIRATIELRQGSLAAAQDSARQALDLVTPRDWGVGVAAPIATALYCATAMGRLEDAARYASMRVPDEAFHTVASLHYLQARGRYYLAVHRPAAALSDFRACAETMTAWNLDVPAIAPWRTDAALAWFGAGRTDRARELAEEQLALADQGHRRVRGISLRLLAKCSELKLRPSLLGTSVGLLEDAGDKHELALALDDLAKVSYTLGNSEHARVLRRKATSLAAGCGTDLPGCSRIDSAASAEPAPTAQLSDAERRVALLAARGRTNRQIAAELFITVSTVEQHLTRIYRKMKVDCRTELALRLDLGIG